MLLVDVLVSLAIGFVIGFGMCLLFHLVREDTIEKLRNTGPVHDLPQADRERSRDQ